MSWERWRIPLMLAPTLSVIIILFIGALVYGFVQSLGWNPRIGATDISLDAYYNIMFGEEHSQAFWTGLALTLWVSIASTVISAILAITKSKEG